jgi:hypothetical protein
MYQYRFKMWEWERGQYRFIMWQLEKDQYRFTMWQREEIPKVAEGKGPIHVQNDDSTRSTMGIRIE